MVKINTLYSTFLCLCFSICFQSFSQNTTQRGPQHSEIPIQVQVPQNDSLSAMREHIVLQLANDQINNDQLFFKAYLLTGPLQNRYSNSRVLHIELQDTEGSIIKKQFHKIGNGMVTGNIELPKRIKEGTYTVKAYTQWMKNFSDTPYTQKQVQVGKSTDTFVDAENRVSIIPEGDTFLQNYKNKIVFQIPPQLVSKDGYIGTVTDGQGRTITKVQAYAPGIGIAFIEPEINTSYFLKLENNTLYPFPESQDKGYLMRINNIEATLANIQITRSEKSKKTPLKLIGTLRGIPYFEKSVVFSNNSADIKLDKEKIPKGILELQLLDQEGTQLAKRPIWIDGTSLQIAWDQIDSTDNEMVYKVKVTDQMNKPVKTQVALSVIQEEKSNTEFENMDLLTSTEYQKNKIITDRSRRFLQDMYVLTALKNKLQKSPENTTDQETVQFPIQKGLEITGYAYDLNNTLLNNTPIQVMFTNKENVWVEETITNSEGILRLKNLHLDGETKIVFRTQGDNTKSRLVTIERIPEYGQKLTDVKGKRITKIKEKAQEAIKKSEKELAINPFDTTGTLVLNNVAISGEKAKKIEEMPSVYGIKPPKHRIMYQDFDRPKQLLQLLEEMPSVLVNRGNEFIPTVSIVGGNGPILFVLDGIPLSQGSGAP
ncbi:hypothetical protein, partial [uncultured Dokdonia sp.]|uniref:hypothetical protein n=1 Tax=uncultured Dokdonia sp. TaxID=575653 RepID=UPI0026116023